MDAHCRPPPPPRGLFRCETYVCGVENPRVCDYDRVKLTMCRRTITRVLLVLEKSINNKRLQTRACARTTRADRENIITLFIGYLLGPSAQLPHGCSTFLALFHRCCSWPLKYMLWNMWSMCTQVYNLIIGTYSALERYSTLCVGYTSRTVL